MARKRKTMMIEPIEKKAPVESISRIPDTANLSDYDKIVAKMANSSDEIIDKALEKFEPKRVEHVQKQEEEVEEIIPPPIGNPEKGFDETPNPKVEKIDMTSEYLKTIQELNNEILELKYKLSESNPSKIHEMHAEEINNLINKNDDLILKNSELEFEISRLMSENNVLKQRLESIETQIRTQANPRISQCRPQQRNQSNNVAVQRRNPQMTMNGYEFWN